MRSQSDRRVFVRRRHFAIQVNKTGPASVKARVKASVKKSSGLRGAAGNLLQGATEL